MALRNLANWNDPVFLKKNGNPITVRASDFLAATFCHEIDHLDGIMFMNKARKVNE